MNELQATATAYAAMICRELRLSDHDYDLVLNLVRNAYEQGWVDRDTQDLKAETSDEFFNESDHESDRLQTL